MKSFLAACFLLVSPVFAGSPLFSLMEDGDKVHVTESSKGCFHNTTLYYEISREEGTYTFTQYRITWDGQADARKIVKKEVVGSTPITRTDVARLDGLLGFYRVKEKKVFSTTQDSLIFEFRDSNGLVITEKMKDGSGGYGLDEREDVVTFAKLARKFKEEATK